jgi:hypothetical protein
VIGAKHCEYLHLFCVFIHFTAKRALPPASSHLFHTRNLSAIKEITGVIKIVCALWSQNYTCSNSCFCSHFMCDFGILFNLSESWFVCIYNQGTNISDKSLVCSWIGLCSHFHSPLSFGFGRMHEWMMQTSHTLIWISSRESFWWWNQSR